MLPKSLQMLRRPIVLGLHLALIPIGYFTAYALRFEFAVPDQYMELFGATVLLLLPIRLGSFVAFGVHRGWWRHVGMRDLVDLLKAITVSSGLFAVALYFAFLGPWSDLQLHVPRSVLALDWLLALLIFGGARFTVRAAREGWSSWDGEDRRGTRALVIGAGEAADRLLRQIRVGRTGFRPVALVDDDPIKRGMRLHGIPVLGGIDDIPRLAREQDVGLIVIAIPSASREDMQRIVEHCAVTKIDFKIVPSLHELLDGRARVSQLRRVQVEDLLGRESVELNLRSIFADLSGKSVIITGGAGSIGSELARQVASFGAGRLILIDQAESPLYFADLQLQHTHPELEVIPVVADVTDRARLDEVFRTYAADYVFHAAAYKHVPLMEMNPIEAVRNNIFGTLCVAECAARHATKKFVLISTDKAVRPSSVMGATKRVAERIVLGWPSLRDSSTDFRAVRFGNVLGSEGSVIPLFRSQLARGGPLTVTHPEVTRYFMTIPEAAQLVLQAAQLPEAAGRISMLEMGAPVRITELAENLVRLSGLEPYKDVPIVFSGLRPGEKLFEELMSDVELTVPTSVEKIRVVETDEVEGKRLQHAVDRLAAATAVGNRSDLIMGLCALVPECVEPLRENGVSAAQDATRRIPTGEHVRAPAE